MQRPSKDSDMNIGEQAAQWLCDLEDAGPDTLAQFAAWLRQSPRHVEEFLTFQAMWKEFKGIDREKQIDIDALVAEASAQNAGNVVQLQPAPSLTLPRSTGEEKKMPPPLRSGGGLGRGRAMAGIRMGSIAAGIAVFGLCVAVAAYFFTSSQPTYSTAVGEQRTVKLADGSFVYLNTASRIEVRFSRQSREVRLLEGEALFDVQTDASRPFRVNANSTVIRVLGTQFNVYRRSTAITVAVIEGKVKVDNAELTAGEEANVAREGHVAKRARPDIQQAAAWRARRLVFRSDSLDAVAAEFNRYNTQKIRIDGRAAGERKLIGTFSADDPQSLVDFLTRESGLTVEKSGSDFVIRENPHID